MTNQIAPPRYALVSVLDESFIVQDFDYAKHMYQGPMGSWSKSGVTLFSERSEVEHLREFIIN